MTWGEGANQIGRGENIYALAPSGRNLWAYDAQNGKIVYIDLRKESNRELWLTETQELDPREWRLVTICSGPKSRLQIVVQARQPASLSELGGRDRHYVMLGLSRSFRLTKKVKFLIPHKEATHIEGIAARRDGSFISFSRDYSKKNRCQCLSLFDVDGKLQWKIEGDRSYPLRFVTQKMLCQSGKMYLQDTGGRTAREVDIKAIGDDGEMVDYLTVDGYDLLGLDRAGKFYIGDFEELSAREKVTYPHILVYDTQGELKQEMELPELTYPSWLSKQVIVSERGEIFFLNESSDEGLKIWVYR